MCVEFRSAKRCENFGLTIFNLFDYLSSNILLPVGAMICSIFVGWIIKRKFVRSQFSDFGRLKARYVPLLIFSLRWICPAAILLIFLNSIGLI